MNRTKYNWSYLSKYRNCIYGVGILSIMIFHSLNTVELTNSLFSKISRAYCAIVGSVGVDIFIIISGVSLYYSLKKNSNVRDFYLKRCKRILIPYLIVGSIYWYIIDIVISQVGIISLVKDLLFINFFTNGDRSLWYIFAIMIMYLIYPALFQVYNKLKRFSGMITICLIGLIIGLNYLIYLYDAALYSNIEIMLTRFPAFVIGVYCGKRVYDMDSIRKLDLGIIVSCIFLNLIFDFLRGKGIVQFSEVMFRYMQILRGLVCIVLIILVLDKIKNIKVEKMLSKIGNYSLELYLVHVTVLNIFRKNGINHNELIWGLAYITIIVIFVIILKKICDKIFYKI